MTTAAKTTYTVTVNGKAHTRKSPRTYTHAIMGRRLLADAIANAKSATYDRGDRNNFNWYSFIAEQPAGQLVPVPAWGAGRTCTFSADEVATAKEKTEGGFKAYADRMLAQRLEWVSEADAKGAHDWKVLGWAGSPDLASKRVSAETSSGYYTGGVAAVAAFDTVTL